MGSHLGADGAFEMLRRSLRRPLPCFARGGWFVNLWGGMVEKRFS
jgi:hypothetical protein